MREASQVHNAQVEKRRYEALSAQIHQAIEEARQGNGTLTVREILQRTGLTHRRLSESTQNSMRWYEMQSRIIRPG